VPVVYPFLSVGLLVFNLPRIGNCLYHHQNARNHFLSKTIAINISISLLKMKS
jgi:hypothetical protein